MITYAVVNKKGGAGKTTTALALVDGLSKAGKKVLAIDIDPQGNLSSVCHTEPDVIGSAELITKQPHVSDVIQHKDSYDLIAGDGTLVDVEANLFKVIGKEAHLREALDEVKDEYDYCIIDTPPSIGLLTVNAMVAADKIIVTANADAFSADGLVELYRDISAIQKYFNPELKIDGILLTRYSERTTLAREMLKEFRQMAEKIDTKVYKTKIRVNVSIREAQYTRQLLSDYDKDCNGAQDYKVLLKEMEVL